MAQIDLRNATIYIRDGFVLAGAVNQPASPGPIPANGDTSITVDGFTSAIQAGAQFTIVGSTDTYTVVSTTGGSTPTAIVFTPALSTAKGVPADNAIVTISPNQLTVTVGEGNLTYEEKRDMEYVRNKRQIAFVRTGDDQPMEVSMDFVWEFIKSDTGQPPTVEEALKKIGNASAWVTSGADICEPYCVDILIEYIPPCLSVKKEKILLKEYRWESLPHDLKAGTVSTKGKCKVLSPVITRVTQ